MRGILDTRPFQCDLNKFLLLPTMFLIPRKASLAYFIHVRFLKSGRI